MSDMWEKDPLEQQSDVPAESTEPVESAAPETAEPTEPAAPQTPPLNGFAPDGSYRYVPPRPAQTSARATGWKLRAMDAAARQKPPANQSPRLPASRPPSLRSSRPADRKNARLVPFFIICTTAFPQVAHCRKNPTTFPGIMLSERPKRAEIFLPLWSLAVIMKMTAYAC